MKTHIRLHMLGGSPRLVPIAGTEFGVGIYYKNDPQDGESTGVYRLSSGKELEFVRESLDEIAALIEQAAAPMPSTSWVSTPSVGPIFTPNDWQMKGWDKAVEHIINIGHHGDVAFLRRLMDAQKLRNWGTT